MERKIFPYRCLLLVCLSFLASCSFFSRQPALPRRAAIEATIAGDEKFNTLVQNADIIYFPSESVTLTARSDAAWKLFETVERNGAPFALGWDLISSEEQSVLDQWAKGTPANDNEMPRLHFHPDSGDQKNCRNFLRQATRSGAHILALRCPPAISPAQSSEQFAAAQIAEYFRQHGSEKMLVFLRRHQLDRNHGVPYFVAQETKARQLVLNAPQTPRRSRLLARN